MFKKFIKYHSLGNDLILFDLYNKPNDFINHALQDNAWKPFVIHLCDRHYGIGADGVLILSYNNKTCTPEMHIFNADGSQAENCLNGTRCVTDYLYSKYIFQNRFFIKIGKLFVSCEIQESTKNNTEHEIITRIKAATNTKALKCSVPTGTFSGHVVSIGNPHFIVFEQTILEWLQAHGKSIESHELFPDKTNVEFAWKSANEETQSVYTVFIYERGCGITLACGTGAAAVVSLLAIKNQIAPLQKITIKMPGGQLCAWMESDGQIALQANTKRVFTGSLENGNEIRPPKNRIPLNRKSIPSN
jgi:diaminopimelate epimerase